jgi:TATA-binding protein-associated factor Taf7
LDDFGEGSNESDSSFNAQTVAEETAASSELLLSTEMKAVNEEPLSDSFVETTQHSYFDLSLALAESSSDADLEVNQDGSFPTSHASSEDDLDIGHISETSLDALDDRQPDHFDDRNLSMEASFGEEDEEFVSGEAIEEDNEPEEEKSSLIPANFKPVEFLICTLEQRSFKKMGPSKNPYYT